MFFTSTISHLAQQTASSDPGFNQYSLTGCRTVCVDGYTVCTVHVSVPAAFPLLIKSFTENSPISDWRITSRPLTPPGPLTQSFCCLCRCWIIDQHSPEPKTLCFHMLKWKCMHILHFPALVVSLAASVPCIDNSYWSAVFNAVLRQVGHFCQRSGRLVSHQLLKSQKEKFGVSDSSWAEMSD